MEPVSNGVGGDLFAIVLQREGEQTLQALMACSGRSPLLAAQLRSDEG